MSDSMNGYSPADMAAVMGNNGGMNGMWNNPFMYLVWLALFRNGGFGFGGNGEAAAAAAANVDINGRINQLSQQISDNQNTNTINGGIAGVHDQLHGINNGMALGFAGVNSAINAASTANLMSQKDAQAQMASCCCDIKTNILNQTNQLQSRIDQLSNGVQTGFANLGFLTQQQTNELNTNANMNTQRILDKMCSDTTQGLRDKLAQASQDAQTSYLISQLKTTA